ncbi:MAG: hypothetical protein LIP23_00990 [Planctomycetes bacterium]|nr:hypothetical protein [Planctomycetota bacterium]
MELRPHSSAPAPVPHQGGEPDAGESLAEPVQLLFGSTIDYFNLDLLTAQRRVNLAAIAKIALRRLGDKVANSDIMPPRVAARLVDTGSYISDPFAANYWAGVAAGARSLPGRDDRGNRWLRLLERLSFYQIRAHYLFYSTLRRLCIAVKPTRQLDFETKRYRLAVFAPVAGFVHALGLADDEIPSLGIIAADILSALGMENLLDGSNTGTEKYLKTFFKSRIIQGDGIVYAPSLDGIRLFMWAFAQGDRPYGAFVDEVPDFTIPGVPEVMDGAALIYDD